jgi:hypothetical protein
VQDGGGLDAGDAPVLPEDPGVDLGAHLRVHHVDGDGDVVDVVLADLVDHLRQRQAVGGQAQLDVGRLLPAAWRKVSKVFFGLASASPGPAMPSTVICGNLAGHGQHLLHRLVGRELLADHAGAASLLQSYLRLQ